MKFSGATHFSGRVSSIVTDKVLDNLANTFPHLSSVDLSGCQNINVNEIKKLVNRLGARLKSVTMVCTMVTKRVEASINSTATEFIHAGCFYCSLGESYKQLSHLVGLINTSVVVNVDDGTARVLAPRRTTPKGEESVAYDCLALLARCCWLGLSLRGSLLTCRNSTTMNLPLLRGTTP